MVSRLANLYRGYNAPGVLGVGYKQQQPGRAVLPGRPTLLALHDEPFAMRAVTSPLQKWEFIFFSF